MSIAIKDGRGSGREALVDKEFRMGTTAVVTSPLEHASEHAGNAAIWNSTYSATGGEEVISISNQESERRLRISRMWLVSQETSIWTLFENTAAGPAAGTTLTYVNPDLTSGVQRSETSFGNASVTGSLSGNTLWSQQLSADVPYETYFEGAIILGKDDVIALTLVTGTTNTVNVTILGFWEDPV